MKVKRGKRFLALALTACMAWPPAAAMAENGDVTVPEPYYEYTFDEGVDGTVVHNQGTKEGADALIDGEGGSLGIEDDEQRGSKVLNLPGGGLGQGCLTLPEDMFSEVTDAGFAFSFWINIDESADHYNRIFSASSFEMNSNNGDNGAWNAPEFTFVTGGTDTSASAYNTSVMMSDRNSQMKLVWDQAFMKGQWQHVTVSVSPSAYDVYLDGAKIGTEDRNGNEQEILERLFADESAELKGYKHNAIGRSVYSTDNDLKAKVDEFRFYNVALTEDQAKAAYDSYAVAQDKLESLQNRITELRGYSISFYTRESYEALCGKLLEAEEVAANPVTDANIERMLGELETAESELVYYEGVTAETTFTNAQLKAETQAAQELAGQSTLTEESKNALDLAVSAALEVLEKDTAAEQAEVDEALRSIREAVDQAEYDAALHFDASENTGDLFHGSTGFLYGVSEVGVPSADLIKAIQPKILVQKAADGKQHPSGDGYRLENYLTECGVENIQIYLQDYYLEWPYENTGIEDYKAKVETVVRKIVEGKTDEELSKYSFVLFNEPDNIWYWNNVNGLCRDWKTIYDTVKSINPSLKVAGPNYASYNSNNYRTFLEFCRDNDCLPEYITWHELQKDKLTSFQSHCDEVKKYVETYYADSDIEPILFVNETVNFDDVGTPGQLVNWLSIFEEEKIYASLPYWGLANSLNELAADTNKPNGAWWTYKWYAQMTGHTIPVTLENIDDPNAYGRLYGLSSVDEDSSMIYTLFGGQAGSQTICIDNIKATDTFKDAQSAHVKIYRSKFTGHHGFADETPVVYEGDVKFAGDDLVYTVENAELMDAYFAIVTPATGKDSSQYATGPWQETYEAEDASLIGNAQAFAKTGGSDLARSNRAEVGGINSENDGVEFTVNVPEDGQYRLNIYYTNQAPQVDPMTLEYVDAGGQNRAVGALVTHKLTVDGEDQGTVVYDSTVKWGYYNYKTVYLDLTEGEHKIKLMHAGEDQNGKDINSMLCAILDKIDLTKITEETGKVVIEPEELSGSQEGFGFSQDMDGYTGAGCAQGSGDFSFYVCAPEDGYYTVNTAGSGSAELSKNIMVYAPDAKAQSEVGMAWQDLMTLEIGSEADDMIWLTAGMNELKLSGSGLVLDQITFIPDPETTEKSVVTIEAEECETTGTDAGDGYNYLRGSAAVPTVVETEYASGGKAVEGFRGGQDNQLTLKVNVKEAGDYKLSVFYSNDEPAPVMKTQSGADYVHPYNTDLVERYAQISVNGGTPQTVYFRNTFCWDVYRNTVVDVTLQEGDNTITFTNDNSYKFSEVQDDFTPRFDKFEIASAVLGSTDEPPVDPDDPDKPPVDPDDPDKPTDPDDPADDPDKPTDPDDPDDPANPDDPADDPDTPGNPDDPDDPGSPAADPDADAPARPGGSDSSSSGQGAEDPDSNTSAVQTGDTNVLVPLLMAVVLASGGVIAVTLLWIKRKHRRR